MSIKEAWGAILHSIIVLGVIAGSLLLLPTIAGYGYAITFLPFYGISCKGTALTSLFKEEVLPDNYRVFLLRRDCNAGHALNTIIENIHKANKTLQIEDPDLDPGIYSNYYKGKSTPTNSDELQWLKVIEAEMHQFKQLDVHLPHEKDREALIELRVKEAENECFDRATRGITDPIQAANAANLFATVCEDEGEMERHRGENRFCGNTAIDHLLCRPYLDFFGRNFTSATNDGADLMAQIIADPILRSLLYICYIMLSTLLLAMIARLGALIVHP